MSTLAEQIAAIQARKRKAPQKGTTVPAVPSSSKAAPKKPAPSKKAAPKVPPVDPNDPAGVTGPLTPAKLDAEAAAAVRTRFGGTEKELAGQGRVSTQMQANIDNWFDQYKVDVEKARQRTADVNTGIQVAQAAQAQQAQAVDSAAAVTPEATQAAAARRSTSDSFGSMLAAQGSAQNAYQADQGRIGSGQQQQEHLNEAGRARSIEDALTELQGQKGDFETGYRADARAAERKSQMENAAFGLDQATAASDAKLKAAAQKALDDDRTADNKRSTAKDKTDKMDKDRQYQLDKDKLGAATAKDNYQKAHGLGPYKPAAGKDGPSAADKRAEQKRVDDIRVKSSGALTRINKAQGKWESLAGSKVTTGAKDDTGHDKLDANGQPETRPITDADRVAELVTEGYTKNEIHLMRLIAEGKKWGKQEIAMAHQLGIRVPRKYLSAKDATNDPGSAGNVVSKNGTGDMTTGK